MITSVNEQDSIHQPGKSAPVLSTKAAEVNRIEQKLKAADALVPQILYGSDKKKYVAPDNEKPWMRQAALLLAANYTIGQVSEVTSVSRSAIGAARSTPWFQEMVLKLVEERAGGKDVLDLIKASAIKSHFVLDTLLEDPKTKPELRASVAFSFMDRHFGKAKQSVEMTAKITSLDPVAEAAQLAKQNEELCKRLGLPPPVPIGAAVSEATGRNDSEIAQSYDEEPAERELMNADPAIVAAILDQL